MHYQLFYTHDLPETTVNTDHRMSDIIKWATPAESILGLESGTIIAVCERNYLETMDRSLNDDIVCSIVLDYMNNLDQAQWEGTMTALLTALTSKAPSKLRTHKDWPKQPQSLSRHLNRRIKGLHDYGIDIQPSREGGTGSRKYIITNRNFISPEVVEPQEGVAA